MRYQKQYQKQLCINNRLSNRVDASRFKLHIKPLIISLCFMPLMAAGADNSEAAQVASFSDVKAITQLKTPLEVRLLNSEEETATTVDEANAKPTGTTLDTDKSIASAQSAETSVVDTDKSSTKSSAQSAAISPDMASGEESEQVDPTASSNNHCQLVLEGYQPITLALEKDCYFFADTESGKAFTYAYPDVQVQSVLLIGGTKSPLVMDERKHRKLPVDNYCTDQIQALLLTDDGYALTQVQQDTPACVGDRLDEKVYYTMARFERMDTVFTKAGSDSTVADEKTNLFDKIKTEIESLFK